MSWNLCQNFSFLAQKLNELEQFLDFVLPFFPLSAKKIIFEYYFGKIINRNMYALSLIWKWSIKDPSDNLNCCHISDPLPKICALSVAAFPRCFWEDLSPEIALKQEKLGKVCFFLPHFGTGFRKKCCFLLIRWTKIHLGWI